jgi:pyruvate dehydrogenase E2 component (dihydrolipoamide acetyltransferase)
MLSIDEELKVLIEKALGNKLKPEEYAGATFTISNLGSYGIHDFTAVINPPGSAILAIGEARKEPVIGSDDEIGVQTNMVLSLSCDHRVIDGSEGALFMKDLKGMMEHPIQVLY